MKNQLKLSVLIATLSSLWACEHATAPKQETSKPQIEALDVQVQGQSSNISIGIVNGAPKFVGESSVICNPNGQCGNSGGVSLNGISGDMDLSGFAAGNVAISITIGDDAYNAGWRFPSEPLQAVAIVIYPQNGPKPDPVFGTWPELLEFGAPSVSGDLRMVSFTDADDDLNVYEYSVAINGPSGRVVLDPRITNGGIRTK